jgi:hypothetical protein
VAGAIIFAVVMILVVPIGIMFGGAIWSALFGWVSSEAADAPEKKDEQPAEPSASGA